MKNIVSPRGTDIVPGVIDRITTARSETQKIAQEKAADKRLYEQILGLPKSETQQVILPGTLHSSFVPLTERVSVTEEEVRKTYALGERAVLAGRIPPRAGEGRFLDAII